MNFCGIICEFNPFHNGHEYIIKEAKKLTGLGVLCLMSGNFVQRGEVAIQEKYERAQNAIASGADVVLELPTIYACSNAENFALGAVKTLSALGISHLAFGIKNTTLEVLGAIAELKFNNSEKFKSAFKNEIQNGINFNTALKRSIAKTLGNEKLIEVLNEPNNILAVEYLTAIKRLNSKIIPVAIERTDGGFYSKVPSQKFMPATLLRDKILSGEDISKFIPKNAKCTSFLDKNALNLLKSLQIFKIRELSAERLALHYDYSEGIEFRVKSVSEKCTGYDQILTEICTPRYREPRVKKLLLYPLLGVTKSTLAASQKTRPVAKLLAIKKDCKNFLSAVNKSKVSIIVSNKDYENLGRNQKKIIQVDLTASLVFATISGGIYNKDKKIGTMFL